MLLLLLAAASSALFADELTPLDPPDTERFLRWGPFRVRPGLTIPGLGYDNNVFAVTDQTAAANSAAKVGDYYIALAPRLEGLVLFGHSAFLTFEESLEFYAYASQTELDYFNQFGKARLTIPFRKVGIFWDLGFDRTRDRPYDAQDIRPVRKYYPLGLGLITKFGWRTDSELGVFSNRYTAEDPDAIPPPTNCSGLNCYSIAQLNNRTEEGIRFKFRYLAVGRTRLLLELAERQIKFNDAAVALSRNGEERRQLIGVDFGLGGSIYGTFRVGHADFSLASPSATGFNGPVADIALGYNFGGSGSHLSFTGARDVRYTIYDATPLYLYTGGDLSFVKYFNRFIGAEVGAGRAVLDFLGDPQNRVDHDTNVILGVRFRFSENDLGRKVEYAFRYTRWIVNSTRDDLDQNRGTVGFGVTFGY